MVKSTAPRRTSSPSLKWTRITSPPMRERTSTVDFASTVPVAESSSGAVSRRASATVTGTGGRGGGALSLAPQAIAPRSSGETRRISVEVSVRRLIGGSRFRGSGRRSARRRRGGGERAGVVGEARQRQQPVGAGEDLLRPRVGEGALRRQEVEDAADALVIAAGGDARRLVGRGEQVLRRGVALRRRLQVVVARPHLQAHLVGEDVGVGALLLGLGAG